MNKILLLSVTLFFSTLGYCQQRSDDTEPSLYAPAAVKADFEQLYSQLQLAHFNLFANLPKQDYDQLFSQYLAAIDIPMNETDVRMHFQRFVALGKVAHASVDLPVQDFIQYLAEGGATLPLFVKIEKDVVRIEELLGDARQLQAGSELVSINDRPMESWLQEFRALISADNQSLSNTLLEQRFSFFLWLSLGELPMYSIAVKTPTGEVSETVKTSTREEQEKFISSQPVSVRNFQTPEAMILNDNLAYLRPGPFFNTEPEAENIWDNTEFRLFIDDAFDQFNRQNSPVLIIDLRNNPGGGNSFSDHMLAWFADKPFKFASEFIVKVSAQSELANQKRLAVSEDPQDASYQLAEFYAQHQPGETFPFDLPYSNPHKEKRFAGEVYMLVNRYSYSNAVSVAAIAQDYEFATVIGEKTADLATTFGAMEHFELTHTKIKVGYPKALIVRPNGDRLPDGVTPDIELTTPDGLDLETYLQLVIQEIHNAEKTGL